MQRRKLLKSWNHLATVCIAIVLSLLRSSFGTDLRNYTFFVFVLISPVEDFTPVAEDFDPLAEDFPLVAEDFDPVAEDFEPVAEDFKPVAEDFDPVGEDWEVPGEDGEVIGDEFEALVEGWEVLGEELALWVPRPELDESPIFTRNINIQIKKMFIQNISLNMIQFLNLVPLLTQP